MQIEKEYFVSGLLLEDGGVIVSMTGGKDEISIFLSEEQAENEKVGLGSAIKATFTIG